jgi:adenylate kinase
MPRMSRRVVILLGPPGSGKGTQAAFLSNILQVPVISTGNILRKEVSVGTPLGETVGGYLAAGELVPDALVNQVVGRTLSDPDCHDGFVLDGYPRTVAQAEFLDQLLADLGVTRPAVIYIEVPMATLIERLLGRLECTVCGRTYHTRHWSSAHPGACDDDGGPLVRRSDDVERVIRERLRQWTAVADPLLDHYRTADLHRVDGTVSPANVLESVENALGLYAWRSTLAVR